MTAATVCVGDKLKTPGRLGVQHFGIYVGHRNGCTFGVVHNSKIREHVILEEWHEFCRGNPVYVVGRPDPGFEEFVAAKALAYVGKQYRLLSFNCEHFANLVVDGEEVSPQLREAAKSTVGGAAIGTVAVLSAALIAGMDIVRDSATGGFRNKRTGEFASAPPFRRSKGKKRSRSVRKRRR
jgi:hypothetical protein